MFLLHPTDRAKVAPGLLSLLCLFDGCRALKSPSRVRRERLERCIEELLTILYSLLQRWQMLAEACTKKLLFDPFDNRNIQNVHKMLSTVFNCP